MLLGHPALQQISGREKNVLHFRLGLQKEKNYGIFIICVNFVFKVEFSFEMVRVEGFDLIIIA